MILLVISAAIALSARCGEASPQFDPRFAASRSTVAKQSGVRWVNGWFYFIVCIKSSITSI